MHAALFLSRAQKGCSLWVPNHQPPMVQLTAVIKPCTLFMGMCCHLVDILGSA